jgi:hypothetical protein
MQWTVIRSAIPMRLARGAPADLREIYAIDERMSDPNDSLASSGED